VTGGTGRAGTRGRRRRIGHLVRRFVTSVRGREPDGADERWAASLLSSAELALWQRLHATDRAHAVEVARRVASTHTGPVVLAAALMHDIGKVEADSGVVVRVAASLLGPLVSDGRAEQLARRQGVVGSLGRQLRYPGIGARLLADAGSDRLVIQWAAEHHQPRHRWTVDPGIGAVLQAADDASR
jgi:hypothetical protein